MTEPGPELTRSFLQREIDTDRRTERAVVAYAIIAIVIVAALVVVRQLFFL